MNAHARGSLIYLSSWNHTLHTTDNYYFRCVFLFAHVFFVSSVFLSIVFLLLCRWEPFEASSQLHWNVMKSVSHQFHSTLIYISFLSYSLHSSFFLVVVSSISAHFICDMCALKSFTFISAPSGIYLCSIAFEMLLLLLLLVLMLVLLLMLFEYGNRNV